MFALSKSECDYCDWIKKQTVCFLLTEFITYVCNKFTRAVILMINGPKFEISAALKFIPAKPRKKKRKKSCLKVNNWAEWGTLGAGFMVAEYTGGQGTVEMCAQREARVAEAPSKLCPVAVCGTADRAQPSATCTPPQEQQLPLRPPTLKPKPIKATFNCSGSRQWCKLLASQGAWIKGTSSAGCASSFVWKVHRVLRNAVCWLWAELEDWISLGKFHLSAPTTSSCDDRKSKMDSKSTDLWLQKLQQYFAMDFIQISLLHLLYTPCALLLPPLTWKRREIITLCPSHLQGIQSLLSPVDSPSSSLLPSSHHSSDGTVVSISLLWFL